VTEAAPSRLGALDRAAELVIDGHLASQFAQLGDLVSREKSQGFVTGRFDLPPECSLSLHVSG
jgi:hypothetical protein